MDIFLGGCVTDLCSTGLLIHYCINRICATHCPLMDTHRNMIFSIVRDPVTVCDPVT